MMEDLGIQTQLDKAIPETFRNYITIDYNMFTRDLELGGDITYMTANDGGIYVFRN